MRSGRLEAMAKYGGLYTRFRHDPIDPFTCFYCGMAADTMDHQPPVTRVSDYRSLGLENEVYVKVAACLECNILASDKLTETIWDRHDFVKNQLARKYRKELRHVLWEDREVNELGGYLHRYISKKNAQLAILVDRLDYCDGIQAYIDHYENHEPNCRNVS